MSNKQKIVQVNPKDNVLVALHNLVKGETVAFNGTNYTLQEDIGAKHKFFMQDMQPGDEIIMYGVLVGKAKYSVFREIGYFIGIEFEAGSRWSRNDVRPQHLIVPRHLTKRTIDSRQVQGTHEPAE